MTTIKQIWYKEAKDKLLNRKIPDSFFNQTYKDDWFRSVEVDLPKWIQVKDLISMLEQYKWWYIEYITQEEDSTDAELTIHYKK